MKTKLPLRGGSTRLKITWMQQRQHHKAQESARERMLSLLLSKNKSPVLKMKILRSSLLIVFVKCIDLIIRVIFMLPL